MVLAAVDPMANARQIIVNPNFSGPAKDKVLLARDVLLDEFANHGLVTDAIEEHLAGNWERLNDVALMRTWEERAYLQQADDSQSCVRCGVDHTVVVDKVVEGGRVVKEEVTLANWKPKGAPHSYDEAKPYFDRRAHFSKIQAAKAEKSIDMDPEIAKERIEHLMRSPNPSEHSREINELRTQVLGFEAIELDDAPPQPFVSQGDRADGAAAAQQAKTDAKKLAVVGLDAKMQNFLSMDHREQKVVLEVETDLEFLAWVPRAKVIPTVKVAAKNRAEAIKGKGKES